MALLRDDEWQRRLRDPQKEDKILGIYPGRENFEIYEQCWSQGSASYITRAGSPPEDSTQLLATQHRVSAYLGFRPPFQAKLKYLSSPHRALLGSLFTSQPQFHLDHTTQH